MTPSSARSAASRSNGRRGGRPRGSKTKTATVVAKLSILERIRETHEESIRFLVRVRDGLEEGATVADRIRAVQQLLDRDPDTSVNFRHENNGDPAPERSVKYFVVDKVPYDAPPGWTDQPPAPPAPEADSKAP